VKPGSKYDLLRENFIGKKVKILESVNKDLEKIEGEIVYETKNTFWIRDNKGLIKKVLKSECIFLISINDKTMLKVDGKYLIGTPAERIKKKFKSTRRW